MPAIEKIIYTLDGFTLLEPHWEKLRVKLGHDNVCMTWLWASQWCKYHLGKNDVLHIHVYYSQDQLVGICPVYMKKIAFGYQLNFIATGEDEKVEICSEFQDFLVEPKFKDELLILFSKSINSNNKIVSVDLANVFQDSIALNWLVTLSKFKALVKDVGQRFVIPVADDEQAQLLTFHNKNRRREAKKYIANNSCSCEHLTQIGDFDSFYTKLAELHNLSWNERGTKGAFEEESFLNFHAEFAKKALKQNKLVMFKILYEDETIAVFYGVITGSILHYYQSGIKRHESIPSVGIAMHIEALRVARKRNVQVYDLMKGAKDSYKKLLTKQTVEVYKGTSVRKSYIWLFNLMKLVRKIKNITTKFFS